jgi:gliding motility-associated-like protein
MKKCLLLATLALFFIPSGLRAQNSFDLETDTACVGQLIHLTPHTMNASSYYWGFCSGYLQNTPLENNLGSTFQFKTPTAIEIAKDGNNYYGFALNNTGNQLLRLDFGTKLSNIPTVTSFGSLDTTVSPSPNSIFITQDSGKWYLFVCGGGTGFTSTLSRFDFGTKLSNVPNGVKMGNIGGLLNDPQGICVFRDGDVYYGFVVNRADNRLIRLNFGKNISKTPTATNLGNPGTPTGDLDEPSDIAPIYDQGKWYFLVTNYSPSGGGPGGGLYNIVKLYFGNTLSNNPVASIPQGYRLYTYKQTAISVIKDCGQYVAFVTNGDGSGGNENAVVRVNIPSLASNNWSGSLLVNGTMKQPEDISRVLRDRDSLYTFIVNSATNSLTRLIFPQCHNANIQSSTSAIPPPYRYDTAGTFNIFLALNEGLPNMEMDCKQIHILPVPPITISHDTLICQGDTLPLSVNAQSAVNYFWSPNYNIGDTQGSFVRVFPEQSTNYMVRIPFFNGCVVDTVIKVDVSHVKADAGPDRTIHDGATTVLGGPNTLTGTNFVYQWFPPENINDVYSLYPTVNPPTTKTYYMKVTNTNGCVDIDTVVVKVTCNGFNLPNAFAPDNQQGLPKTFGMKNRQIVTLYYLRIFDRWGRKVFETSDATKEWDGMYNGERAPFGVYVWEAEGACVNEDKIRATGNVTLLR